jgi:hypothetical protein
MAMSMMFFVLLLGGGANTGDLLDYTPTESYWEMRDQRVIDIDTMSAVLKDEDATATDRLMAIRAIGERVLIMDADPDIQSDPAQKAKALAILKPLAESKEPFVGQYAKRSIAWIKGEEPAAYPQLPAEVYEHDLALLPAGMSAVGQLKVSNGIGPIDLASLIPDAKIDGQSMRDQMMQQLLPSILQATQMIGNARADLVTAGMVIEDNSGPTIALVVRGQYDRVAVQMMLEDEFGEQEDWSFYSVGEIEVAANTSRHESAAMLMPSDELFVLLFTDVNDGKLPIDEVAKKLQDANPEPSLGPVLVKQIEAIDRDKAEVWMAMKVTEFMKNERGISDIFGAFDSARAFAVRDTEGMLDINWVGQGSNEAAVKQAAEYMTGMVNETVGEMKAQKPRMPEEMRQFMDPMIKMMESMQFTPEGKTMNGGMKVDPNIGMTMPMMMFGKIQHREDVARDFAVEVAAEDAAEAVEEAVAE